MTSIKAYIRTQSKNKLSVKVRFLLIEGKFNLSYVSDLLVNPLYWDAKKQGYGASKQISQLNRNELDIQIQHIKYLMLNIYNTDFSNGNLTSDILSKIINEQLHPSLELAKEKIELKNQSKKQPTKQPKINISLLDAIDFSLKHNEISYKRKQTYLVVRHSIEKYIYYKKTNNKSFSITLENTSIDILWELEKFFTNEADLLKLNPNIKKIFPKYLKPSVRAKNTVIGFMRILRAVFNFCIKHDMTLNYPFRKFKMKEQVFGSPFYPTREELKVLYEISFDNKTMQEQRDIFLFQCQVGMRINDLYNLTKSNIKDGILEYIPTKTKRYRVKTVSIPLNTVAMEIINKYTDSDQLLPFISQQKYNDYLKKIFTLAKITRTVTLLDPVTNTEIVRPLNEIIHSHAARKYFCANLFEQVKDQSIVAEMSAHSPNSIAFQRYRNISNELKKSLTDNLF
ncbi:MAG: site-specific integrase [Paludibacter sp.]|nr:site-specific integrase [Paludibacter sp.]